MRNQNIKFTGIRNRYKILSLYIFTLFPLCAYAQSTTPTQEILEFYQKYMTACAQLFMEKPNLELDGLFCNMDIKNYVTSQLYKKIIYAYKAGVYGDLAGDSDYFTHTQDFSVEWISGMKTTEIEKSRNNSVVRLFMNVPQQAGELLAVCVRLQRERNDWKIYQVDPSLDTDLPDCKSK